MGFANSSNVRIERKGGVKSELQFWPKLKEYQESHKLKERLLEKNGGIHDS